MRPGRVRALASSTNTPPRQPPRSRDKLRSQRPVDRLTLHLSCLPSRSSPRETLSHLEDVCGAKSIGAIARCGKLRIGKGKFISCLRRTAVDDPQRHRLQPRSHALLGRFVTVHRDAHGCKFVEFSGTSGHPANSKLPNAAVNKSLCRAVALLCHSTAACCGSRIGDDAMSAPNQPPAGWTEEQTTTAYTNSKYFVFGTAA